MINFFPLPTSILSLQQTTMLCQLVVVIMNLRFVLYKPEMIEFGTQRDNLEEAAHQQKERDSLYISTPGGLKP